ncbi:MAG: ATP-dependent RNA helicase HrpA [Candidatus Aminicenantes bacterium]|nr:MAG: ATP-dependent RNA helicase HrpA [Candidatus Aminicenantes bacterium]
MLKDQSYVRRRLSRLQQSQPRIKKDAVLRELEKLEKKLAASVEKKEFRARNAPRVSFPEELPISARSKEIIKAIQENPVVIISGETGCGKSTQIPKMCLKAGRGVAGMIACTQPRRIAAITIAHRIASEIKESLGRSVGYKIRFRDRTSPDGHIKILTDGMLLAETQSDSRLMSYDTLIIDEAHERSLNIDFLLGITRTLLETRPDLKLIITSATLDTEKFCRAFPNAPLIEVSGRQYPVDVEYRPAETFSKKSEGLDYVDLAVEAVHYIKQKKKPGDILVFMPTEQDILETCERLEGRKYVGTAILPLYARLPGTQQGKVYHVKGPKIVVATNVAETSLTIPGIRYVVDTGLARISQYQPGTQINSLPISPISQSSADQRKGRCGRVEHGVCIRLYSEKEFEIRQAFTPPEILRSNLAEVILRMIDLKLGHPADFPFVDRPKSKHIKDGYDTLLELGAIFRKDRKYFLTDKGRIMARMPLDPKISCILLEASREGCLREIAIIAAALSIRDPRERPPEKAERADAIHAPFRHPDSDFLTLLNIWNRYHDKLEKLTSRNKRRRFCHDHFLSFSRMREWGHVHDQILAICEEQKIPLGRRDRIDISDALSDGIHRSILSGYLSNIAVLKERNMYSAAKGREVMVFPGSTIFGKSRPWIVAAEMVRTSRLFARTVSRINPKWLEELGGSLCRYSYTEAHWEKNRGEVIAQERVTLYGLTIIEGRSVSFGRVQPDEAHQIFVRSALVEGNISDPPGFLAHNLALVEQLATIEEKLRRRGYLAGEEKLADFYSQRLPGISDERRLRKYIKDKRGDDFLKVKEEDLLRIFPDEKELADYPGHLEVGELRLPLVYHFAPGEADDGVTLEVPVTRIADVSEQALEWGIPGQFAEKIAALVKALPKRYRKHLVPIAEKVAIICEELQLQEQSLFKTLAEFVRRRFHVDIPASAWAEAEIPPHLRMRVAVIGPDGKELAANRDLQFLKKKRWPVGVSPSSDRWARAKEEWEREGITEWDFGILPEKISVGPFVTAYPALEPVESGANIRLFPSEELARESHRKGVRALFFLLFEKDLGFVRQYVLLPEEMQTQALYLGGKEFLEKAMMNSLQKEAFERDIRSEEEFNACAESLTRNLFDISHTLREVVQEILSAYQRVRMTMSDILEAMGDNQAIKSLIEESRQELETLVPRDFLTQNSLERLKHIPRYLEALRLRVERARHDPAKDRTKAEQASRFIQALENLAEEITADTSFEKKTDIEEYRWMVEEFKVSLFAPELKTAHPISAKRLMNKLKAIQPKS